MTTSAPPSKQPGEWMAAEILEQPLVWQQLLHTRLPEIRDLAAALQLPARRAVLFLARGSSRHAAGYAKDLLRTAHGAASVGSLSPSTNTVYGREIDLRGVLVVAVSQSGSSPDLVATLAAAGTCGATTVAVTNAPSSPLADAADLHFDLRVGPERSVAATKSYTAQLLALYLLIQSAYGVDTAPARALPELAADCLLHSSGAAFADRCVDARVLITLGRGYGYTTAREGALKLTETCYLPAVAFSAAEFMHGPIAMVGPDTPVIAALGDELASAAMQPALAAVHHAGADIVRFGPTAGPEELSPLLGILPLQQLALQLSLLRGNDPDAPRRLHKATATL